MEKKKGWGGGGASQQNRVGGCVRGFVTSPKLSADEGTVASLISLATFLPAGRQRRGGSGGSRARCPPPPSPGLAEFEKTFFYYYFFFPLVLLVGPFHLCPSLQVVVLASNWAVVDMLMRRLGCG